MATLIKILKSKVTPWALCLGLSLIIWLVWGRLANRNREVYRLKTNQEALVSDVEYFKDKLGAEVARVQALELSKNEFELLYKDKAEQVEALRLKVKRLESYTQAVVQVHDTVTVEVSTPIIKNDSIIKRQLLYNDDWVTLSGEISILGREATAPAIANLSYAIRDTLDVVVYREPKRFLFIRYGIKRIDCYVKSRNPRSTVVTGSCVVIKR